MSALPLSKAAEMDRRRFSCAATAACYMRNRTSWLDNPTQDCNCNDSAKESGTGIKELTSSISILLPRIGGILNLNPPVAIQNSVSKKFS